MMTDPGVFADYGYLSGDSTSLLVAKDRCNGMKFAAAVSMKEVVTRTLHVCLRNGSMDWGAKKSPSEQMESPASVSSSVVFRQLRAEGTTTVDEISLPCDSAGNRIAERAILTVGGLVRTTKAVVEENVLEDRDAGPRLTAWMVHHAGSSDLRLRRRTHAIQAIRGAQVLHAAGGFSVNACVSETRFLTERTSSIRGATEARLLGFSLKSFRYIVVDFDGRFRMVRTFKRANADDRWKVVSPRDPFSAADVEVSASRIHLFEWNSREKSIPVHNDWRGIRLMLSRQIHIAIQFRGRLYLKQWDFMTHGTSGRCPGCRALVSGGGAQGHTEDCQIRVEEDRGRESPSSCRSQSSGCDAPTGRALKRVRFAADRVEDDAETPQATSTSVPSSFPVEDATILCQCIHPRLCYPRRQSKCVIKR